MLDITKTVLPIIRETRKMTLPSFGNVAVKLNKSKFASDVVTQIDHDVELFLAQRLKEVDPASGFTGEEFGGDSTTETFWICDPIDGTAHYVRGLPFCTTMLARIEQGQVTFCAIYDFINDIMYHAEKGKGAYQDDQPISVSTRPLADAYCLYETHLDKQENLDIFLKLRGVAGLVKIMASGWEFAMVATGKLDGRITFDPWGHDWDFAPGSLLVAEAGGVVANLGVRAYDYRNHDFIAANPQVFSGLTEGPEAIFPISL